MRGVFGLLLLLGGVALAFGVLTGRIRVPSGTKGGGTSEPHAPAPRPDGRSSGGRQP